MPSASDYGHKVLEMFGLLAQNHPRQRWRRFAKISFVSGASDYGHNVLEMFGLLAQNLPRQRWCRFAEISFVSGASDYGQDGRFRREGAKFTEGWGEKEPITPREKQSMIGMERESLLH